MSVALPSNSEAESSKATYDAEFDGDAEVAERDDDEPLGPSGLCVDKETSCIYTY